jgi:hypothetical protein
LRFGDGGFMTEMQNLSRQLADDLSQGGPSQLLDRLIDHFRAEHQPHALFDALLMRARLQLGVPLVMQHSIDQLPEPQRSQLEDAYLAICREIGLELLQTGRVGEAWPYLRPLGDRAFLAAEFAKVEPTEENQQVLIEILLHEGIDVARGYHLVIENFGTCNAISAFDGVVVTKPIADQQAAAALLVQQVYCELLENVRGHIARKQGSAPQGASIVELLSLEPDLCAGDAYHIDTTHLATALRIARILEQPIAINQAWQLAEYGRKLSPLFHLQDQPPFNPLYERYSLFFAAQLGERVDEALATFGEEARQTDVYHQGALPAEVYAVLLSRTGKHAEAVEAAAELIPPGTHTTGFAPSLLELSRRAGDFTKFLELAEKRGDVVSYATGLLAAQQSAT